MHLYYNNVLKTIVPNEISKDCKCFSLNFLEIMLKKKIVYGYMTNL